MNANTAIPNPDLREWASQTLQVPAHASRREARAACLRKAAEHQWLPPAAVEESHEYWARPDGDKFFPSLLEQAFHDEEFRLRAEVEEFARTFFDLDPLRRQKSFQSLADQCTWSANLRARLHGLAAGLNVDRREWANAAPEEKELAQQVCRLFAMPPRERAQNRWRLLQELESPNEIWVSAATSGPRPTGISKWQDAARSLLDHYPQVAALEPILVDDLAVGATRRQRTASLPRIQPPPGSVTVSTASANAPATPGQSGGYNWIYYVLLFGGIAVSRFFTSTSHSPPPPPLPPLPKVDQDLQRFREQQQQQIKEVDDVMKKLREGWHWDPKTGNLLPPPAPNAPGENPGKRNNLRKWLEQNGAVPNPPPAAKPPAAEPLPEKPGGP